MVELPDPVPVAPELEIITAVPIVADEDEFDAYRLVRHNPPEASDFQPISRARAEREGIPELVRTGLSHFLTVEQAETVRIDGMIAKVRLRKDRVIHVARTRLALPEHIEVWARASALVDSAEVVET